MKQNITVMCTIFLFLFVFLSCQNKPEEQNIIDVSKGQTLNYHPLMDGIETIELIPLETNEKNLIGYANRICMTKSKIYIFDSRTSSIQIFDISGNFINNLHHVGRGPNEYTRIRSFRVTDDGTIYIFSPKKILKYNDELEVVEVTNLSGRPYLDDFYVFDDNNIVFYNSYNSKSEENHLLINYRDHVFGKKYGICTTMDYSFNRFYRYGDIINFVPLFNTNEILGVDKNFNVSSRYKVLLNDDSEKTKNNQIHKHINTNKNRSYTINSFIETNKHIYISYQNSPVKHCLYNKTTKQCFKSKYSLTKRNGGFLVSVKNISHDGKYFIGMVSAVHLSEDMAKGLIADDKISQIQLNKLKNLKTGDNPILIRMKPKD